MQIQKCLKEFYKCWILRKGITCLGRNLRHLRYPSTSCTVIRLLHCALAAAQCIVIGPVCVFAPLWRVGGVYLWVCLCVCGSCYHDNSKLRASILTKLGFYVKVVTISSWLNFGRPASPGRVSAVGRQFLAPPYYSQRAVFASPLSAFFIKFMF